MKYKDRILTFMECKRDTFNKNGLPGYLYFNIDDKEDIDKLSEKKAKDIWEQISACITYNRNVYGLCKGICFWCITNKKCKDCSFGRRHGLCDYETSTVGYLFYLAKQKNLKITKILNRNTYKNFLKIIEETDKDKLLKSKK